MSFSCLVIIPARGGSKGIPRKNLVDLGGKPLIAWSIEVGNALVKRGAVSRCVVSTDDKEIADVARQWGADVPFTRPDELATDGAKAIDYVLHAIDELAAVGEQYESIMLLQPTSPLRDVEAIAAALDRFALAKADSMISCYREDYINDLVCYQDEGSGYLMPHRSDHSAGVRRQEHGPMMVRNGALYLTRTTFLRENGRLVSDRPMLMAMRRIESFNIDTPDDLEILRALFCK